MKILICFGTRPEAIKMAPLCHELKRRSCKITICVTSQHREMLDQVLDFFEIKPDYDLDLMQPNQSLNVLSSRILRAMDDVFQSVGPDLVLVHGDTTTSTMVALAAFQSGIKVGHIEAGLRTYNKQSPFPEELNRQITGRISDFHFAPTINAKQNLIEERVNTEHVIVTGNTVVDALQFAISKINIGFTNKYINKMIDKIDFNNQIILVTGHRRESFGDGLRNICEALLEISKNENVEIVYPVHLNPNVQIVVYEKLSNVKNIHLIEPLDYPSFVWLMNKSILIISDSGGIQEEAPSLNVPVLVTRETTERHEGTEAGCSILVGTDCSKIIQEARRFLDGKSQGLDMINPYGDGFAAIRIVDFIQNNFV